MDLGRIRRALIALTAAYAVALHALILSFVPLPAAALADPGSVLCAYGDTDGTGLPAHHQVPCAAVCAAMGHGMAGAAPLAAVELPTPRFFAAIVEPPVRWVPPDIVAAGPQAPRGPPFV